MQSIRITEFGIWVSCVFIKLWGPCDAKPALKTTTALDPQSLLDAQSASLLPFLDSVLQDNFNYILDNTLESQAPLSFWINYIITCFPVKSK